MVSVECLAREKVCDGEWTRVAVTVVAGMEVEVQEEVGMPHSQLVEVDFVLSLRSVG